MGGSGQLWSFSPSLKPSMAYLVNIAPRAERDLNHLYDDIDAGDSDAALVWFRGLKQAILTLEKHPNRCPQIPESNDLSHLLYGYKPHVYRVVYRVLEKRMQVDVLHVRHGARQAFDP